MNLNKTIPQKYLPLGSVVVLKEAKRPILIYGRLQRHTETNDIYDYVACPYPEGNMSSSQTLLFNHDKIKFILFKGYVDEMESSFQEVLKKIADD